MPLPLSIGANIDFTTFVLVFETRSMHNRANLGGLGNICTMLFEF